MVPKAGTANRGVWPASGGSQRVEDPQEEEKNRQLRPPQGWPWGTVEPLDKNRLRFFQPTLGFLSAIGKKYGNYQRGYPQVLNGLVLKGVIFENS